MSAAFVLEAIGLCKEFSGVRVLDDVSLQVAPGSIVGIIGENGAGKSTLMKILSGSLAPTSGRVRVDGEDARHAGEKQARKRGIHLVPQELNLVDDLNVAENVFLGQEVRRGGVWLDRRRMRGETRSLLESLDTPLDPDDSVRGLGLAQRQMVEIAKAVARRMRVLILDEPTTVLTPRETEVLFTRVRRLKADGVAVLFVSHKLAEVRRLCDEVVVLRDGRVVSSGPAGELDEAEMARRMVGRELRQMFPPKGVPRDEVLLRVEGLTVPGRVTDLSFDVRRGEILGFAGLTGCGRTEMAEAIYGVRRAAGRRPLGIRSPRDAVRRGVAYLSEDRQGAGILRAFTVTENVTLTSWRRYGRFWIRRRRERERAAHYARAFSLRAPSLSTRLEFLSGGNQQKVALAKGLDAQPRVFILDEPTRGIDVQARRDIYDLIHAMVRDGVGCVVISSDLEELLGLCNRIAVVREGRLAGMVEGDAMTEEAIMLLGTGATR